MSLPSGYIRLEYIESSGTQWVDTSFIPSGENMKIEFDFIYTAAHTNSSLCGTQAGTSSLTFQITIYGDQTAFYVGTSHNLLPKTFTNNTRYQLSAHANSGMLTVSLDGIPSSSAYSGNLDKTLSLALFGNNINGSVSQLASVRLYSCKIYDNNVLVRDFIPCKNLSGVLGLWDDVNAQFYQNAGSGSFTGGAEFVGNLPSGYRQVEYLTASGAQYIDTGLKPDNNTKVEIRAQCAQTSAVAFFGGATTYPQNAFECFTIGPVYGNTPYLTVALYSNDLINIIMDSDGLYKDGIKAVSFNATTFTSPNNLVLFARNRNDGVAGYMTGKIAYCKVYQSGVLVRDFIPCINPQQQLGMYDTVNAQFYANVGSGVFTAGPVVNTSAIYVKVNGEWKQVDGITVNVN